MGETRSSGANCMTAVSNASHGLINVSGEQLTNGSHTDDSKTHDLPRFCEKNAQFYKRVNSSMYRATQAEFMNVNKGNMSGSKRNGAIKIGRNSVKKCCSVKLHNCALCKAERKFKMQDITNEICPPDLLSTAVSIQQNQMMSHSMLGCNNPSPTVLHTSNKLIGSTSKEPNLVNASSTSNNQTIKGRNVFNSSSTSKNPSYQTALTSSTQLAANYCNSRLPRVSFATTTKHSFCQHDIRQQVRCPPTSLSKTLASDAHHSNVGNGQANLNGKPGYFSIKHSTAWNGPSVSGPSTCLSSIIAPESCTVCKKLSMTCAYSNSAAKLSTTCAYSNSVAKFHHTAPTYLHFPLNVKNQTDSQVISSVNNLKYSYINLQKNLCSQNQSIQAIVKPIKANTLSNPCQNYCVTPAVFKTDSSETFSDCNSSAFTQLSHNVVHSNVPFFSQQLHTSLTKNRHNAPADHKTYLLQRKTNQYVASSSVISIMQDQDEYNHLLETVDSLLKYTPASNSTPLTVAEIEAEETFLYDLLSEC